MLLFTFFAISLKIVFATSSCRNGRYMDAERKLQEHSRWKRSSLAVPQYLHLLLKLLSSLCSRDFCNARVFISCSWIAKTYPSTWDDMFGRFSHPSESSWFLSGTSICLCRTNPCCFIVVQCVLCLFFRMSRAFLENIFVSSFSFTSAPRDSCSKAEARSSLSFSCRCTTFRNLLSLLAFFRCIVVDMMRTNASRIQGGHPKIWWNSSTFKYTFQYNFIFPVQSNFEIPVHSSTFQNRKVAIPVHSSTTVDSWITVFLIEGKT